jgi:hypothetical protein
MKFRTTDLAKWGVGKGAPLTSTEVDNNFWEVLLQLADLASNEVLPKEIQSITVLDGQITITLSDGITTFGPFDLPEQAFRWTGDFVPDADYFRMDVIKAEDGAYLVLQDHTAGATFDPNLNSMSGSVYALMFPFQNIYDISFFFPGLVGNGISSGDTMFALRAARSFFFDVDLPLSVAGFDVNPVDGVWEVDIKKNSTVIGSYTFDPTASSGGSDAFFTFSTQIQFDPGDVLKIMTPAAIDSAAKGFTITLAAKKGTIV